MGGQAGTSSRIRNFLGFPAGISGDELAERAFPADVDVRAEFVFINGATGLTAPERVASAVGEGSVAIPQVHQHLQRQATQAVG